MKLLLARFAANGGVSAVLAVLFASVAFTHDAGGFRDYWWWMCGINVGLTGAQFLHWRNHKQQMQKMRDEMNEIGADIVRRMREHYDTYVPLVPNDREPPQETRH